MIKAKVVSTIILPILIILGILATSLYAVLPEQSDKLKPPSLSKIDPNKIEPSDQVFKTEHIWDAKVTIAETIILGESKHGIRRIVPITGGTFEGPNIRGEVVPGGEDWQLIRPDGDVELYARYLLKTHDGYLIQVINRVLIHVQRDAEKVDLYTRSVIDLEAPNGSPYEYLNHAIFLGTLTQPKLKAGEKPYVIIGVYKLM
jgi:hypothetical protein